MNFTDLALRTLACVALLGIAPFVAAAPGPELKLLDDRAAWTLAPQPGGPSWDVDGLLLPALADGNAMQHLALRPIPLGQAASWRTQLRLAAVKPAVADAALGLVLEDATGQFLGVMLRPQERDLIVIRSSGRTWRQPLTDYVAAPMLVGSAGAAHVLTVQSQASRLRISLDGQDVLTTPLLDFRPVKMGVRATNTQARVDQWVVQETGQDSRLARLAGLQVAPGAKVCFEDKFEDGNTASRAAKSLFSGLGSLLGNGPAAAAQGNTPIDPRTAWVDNWSDNTVRFNRDPARKRLTMQTKTDDQTYQTTPETFRPMYHAGVAVQATVTFPVLEAGGNGGVVLLQSFTAAKGSNPRPDELLFAQITPTEVRLYELNTDKDANEKWMLIDSAPHGGTAQRPQTLRLVHQGENAWVFLDGRLMIAADNVKALRINNTALRTEGVTTMEVSHFLFSEI